MRCQGKTRRRKPCSREATHGVFCRGCHERRLPREPRRWWWPDSLEAQRRFAEYLKGEG